MLRGVRSHLTYANVMATVALFLALGGVGYAAVKLPKNSVGSGQIKNSSITGADVKNSSLTGSDVKDRSLSAKDVGRSSARGGAGGNRGAGARRGAGREGRPRPRHG